MGTSKHKIWLTEAIPKYHKKCYNAFMADHIQSPIKGKLIVDNNCGIENNVLMDFWRDTTIPWVNNRPELFNKCIPEALKVEGIIMEFGVHMGGTINVMAKIIPNKIIYGFDWFEGLPEDYTRYCQKGAGRVNHVPYERMPKNVELVVGLIQNTLDPFLNSNEHKRDNVAFIHLDFDLYSSTFYTLDTLAKYKRLQAGTIIQFDELFEVVEESNDVFWYQDEWNAWFDFVKKYNVKFEWFGTQASCCALKIKEINYG